jgi:hypothetical protein
MIKKTILQSLLGCKESEIEQVSKDVLKWGEVYYELVGAKSKTAPASHYTTITFRGKRWSFRELGNKSAIRKSMKI